MCVREELPNVAYYQNCKNSAIEKNQDGL